MKIYKKIVSLLTIGVLSATMTVGCGKREDSTKVLNVYNVGDYIDEELITKFEEETGIKVLYETYDTNEMMYQKVQSGSTNYDLVFPSDYMVEKMRKEDLLQKIDFKNIPNMKYIDKSFLNPICGGHLVFYIIKKWLKSLLIAGIYYGILNIKEI